jgi:hypothetical protein
MRVRREKVGVTRLSVMGEARRADGLDQEMPRGLLAVVLARLSTYLRRSRADAYPPTLNRA